MRPYFSGILGVRTGERASHGLCTVRAIGPPGGRELSTAQWMWSWRRTCIRCRDFRIVTPSGEVRTVHALSPHSFGARGADIGPKGNRETNRLLRYVQTAGIERAEEARHALVTRLAERRAVWWRAGSGQPKLVRPTLVTGYGILKGSRNQAMGFGSEDLPGIFGLGRTRQDRGRLRWDKRTLRRGYVTPTILAGEATPMVYSDRRG